MITTNLYKPKFKNDLTGQRFTRLTVVSYSHLKKYKNSTTYYWKCVCDCGNEKIVAGQNLRLGHAKSCGCLLQEQYENQKTSQESKIENRNKRLSRYRNSEKGQATKKAFQEKYSKTKARKESLAKYNKSEKRKLVASIYNRTTRKERFKNDKQFRFASKLRIRMLEIFKRYGAKKKNKTVELLGCDIKTAYKHIESQFKEGMTWENHSYDTWHIDHIIPVSSFDLTDKEEQKKCFHYTNLQPLWAKENLKKGTKIL